MTDTTLFTAPPRETAGRNIATLIYALFFFAVIIVFLISPTRSVSHYYETAANQWMSSESLYGTSKTSGGGFIYLPHAAILHVPFAGLSNLSGWPRLGDVAWRLVSWLLFGFGSIQLVSLGLAPGVGQAGLADKPKTTSEWSQAHWRAALVTAMLALSCLRIGQSTLVMTSMMLISICAWRNERFWQASGFAVLAVCFKPLAIVLPLLYFATDSRTRKPLLGSVFIAAVAPFLFQMPGYVILQYQYCFEMLSTAAGLGNQFQWAQIFGLLSRIGIEIPGSWQMGLRMAAAVVTLAIVFVSRKLLSSDRQAVWLLAWCGIYLMLFNPRTENSTYGMIGPLYGLFIADQHLRDHKKMAWALFFLAVLTMGSYEIGKYFTPEGQPATWLAPLCCCAFAGYLGIRFRSEIKNTKDGAPQKGFDANSQFLVGQG